MDKVGKTGVTFNEKKLEYLNQMHIRQKFTYYKDQAEKIQCLEQWRKMILKVLPKRFHSKIRGMSDSKMLKVMNMMKSRINFYEDISNHTYFFEEPEYDSAGALKSLKKLK